MEYASRAVRNAAERVPFGADVSMNTSRADPDEVGIAAVNWS